jgi:hypothetical protein
MQSAESFGQKSQNLFPKMHKLLSSVVVPTDFFKEIILNRYVEYFPVIPNNVYIKQVKISLQLSVYLIVGLKLTKVTTGNVGF